MKKILCIKDFSRFPGARYKKLGPGSGEAFRDDVLIPEIETGDDFIINFDGVMGYGSSFLEEVFGGLIRKGVNEAKVLNLIDSMISTEDDLLQEEIRSYVNDAIKEKNK